MTKADKARRRRAARARLHELELREQSFQHGGTHIQDVTFNEVANAGMQVASNLGYTLVLRRNYGVTNGWRLYAVKS